MILVLWGEPRPEDRRTVKSTVVPGPWGAPAGPGSAVSLLVREAVTV